jgi:hypothetical protein
MNRRSNSRRQLQHLDNADDVANNVRAILRIRPLLPSESERGECENAKPLPDGQSVLISAQLSQNRKVETQQHRLDRVFGPSVGQLELFHQSGVEHYCECALEGMSSTVFCFGQTGSGKTYTMSGPLMEENERALHDHTGLQYRAAHFMAHAADEINRTYGSSQFSPVVLRSSYIEIYNEAINDLLNETTGLKLRWSQSAQSFFIENLMMVQCDEVSDLMAVLTEGNNNRKRASHLLNVDSSRSHVIFTIYVERRDAPDAPPKLGKVHFIDLAGSEKLKDSESSGVHCEETKSINTSLFALGHVIASLAKVGRGGGGGGAETTSYVPYRDSTLTKLLMDSLGGQTKTLMVACITPSNRFTEESLRTVSYAMRTKNIVNMNPAVRVDPKQQQLYEMRIELEMMRKENASLRDRLTRYEGGSVDAMSSFSASPSISSSPSFLQPNRLTVAPPPQKNGWAQHRPTESPVLSGTSASVLLPNINSFGMSPFSLAPPGTAQSSASAPAALSAVSPTPLLPSNNTHWTTSSVRSLPAMISPPNPSKAPPSLSSEQYAQVAITAKVQHDNETLRQEVAELRSMILAIKQGDPAIQASLSPTKRSNTMRQGRHASPSSSDGPPLQPEGSSYSSFERRLSTETAADSDHKGITRVSDTATTTSLTTFGFKPAPKKVQKLVFPS